MGNVVTGLVLKLKEVEVRLIVGNMGLVLIVGAMERDVWLVLLAIFAVRARMNIGGPMASHHVGKRIAGVKVPVVSEVHHAIVVAVVQNGSGGVWTFLQMISPDTTYYTRILAPKFRFE